MSPRVHGLPNMIHYLICTDIHVFLPKFGSTLSSIGLLARSLHFLQIVATNWESRWWPYVDAVYELQPIENVSYQPILPIFHRPILRRGHKPIHYWADLVSSRKDRRIPSA